MVLLLVLSYHNTPNGCKAVKLPTQINLNLLLEPVPDLIPAKAWAFNNRVLKLSVPEYGDGLDRGSFIVPEPLLPSLALVFKNLFMEIDILFLE